jgi:hypothetical protein
LGLDIPAGAVTLNLFKAKIAADLVLNASMKAVSPSLKMRWKIMSVLRMTCRLRKSGSLGGNKEVGRGFVRG